MNNVRSVITRISVIFPQEIGVIVRVQKLVSLYKQSFRKVRKTKNIQRKETLESLKLQPKSKFEAFYIFMKKKKIAVR